jgi:uncharacterized membrane protein
MKSNYNGIVLDNSTILLDGIRLSFKEGRYLDTLTSAKDTLTMLEETGQKFILAKEAITRAESDVENKKNIGYDTSEANEELITARNLFQKGKYELAEKSANKAFSQIEQKSDTISNTGHYSTIVIVGVLIAISIMIFALTRRRKIIAPTAAKISEDSSIISNGTEVGSQDNKESNANTEANNHTRSGFNMSPIRLDSIKDTTHEIDIKEYLEKVVEEVGNAKKNHEHKFEETATSSEVHISEKDALIMAVRKMKTKKPYLRDEDKQLLDFLCEKEGSAFESEIRNKFILPRTSLWRLIKRLEREELVEVKKVGGQNLLKLKV